MKSPISILDDIDQWVRTRSTDAIAKRWPARSQHEVRHSTRFRGSLARYAVGIPMVAAAFCAGACEPETIESGWKIHPTERNALPADATALTDDSVPPGLVGDRLERWRGARERLTRARVVANIGSENEGPDLLGQVRGAEVDQEGNLVVLDGQALTVGFFGADGKYMHGFGGPGDGPLEMRRASGLELLGPDQLAVYGTGTVGGTTIFSRVADDWQFDRNVNAPLRVDDTCAFPERLFFAGRVSHASDSGLVYSVRELGDSAPIPYGIQYQDEEVVPRISLSAGQVACVPTLDQVVFAFEVLPYVRSYSARTGDLLWSAYIEDYIQLRLEVDPESGDMISYRSLPHDLMVTALGMSSGHVVLQYRRHGDKRNLEAVRTFLLDPETGHGSLISEALPQIVSFHDGGFVASFEDPYPRLEVRAVVVKRMIGL